MIPITVKFRAPTCMVCGESSLLILNRADFERWRAGAFVQDAFPYMSTGEREALITGTHPACFEYLFGEDY